MASAKLTDEQRKVCLKFDRFIEEYEFELLLFSFTSSFCTATKLAIHFVLFY